MNLGPGLRLAMTTLSVWPARAGRVDRGVAAVAMSLAPVVGLILGAGTAAVAFGLHHAGAQPWLGAAVGLAVLVLSTRALHLDGLADTVDALGSYAGPERALAIMKSPEVGPFGVVAIVLVLLLDAAGIAELAAKQHWWAIAVGVAIGRAAISLTCRRGVPSARPDGLGAMVAGTVPPAVWIGWPVLLGVLGCVFLPERRYLGAVAACAAMAVALGLITQSTRRFGGITGDVIGANCELATAAALVVLALA